MNVLHNKEDAAECVNDTFLSLWNTIPPNQPKVLSAFIGRITRNLSIKKYRMSKAKKREGDETALLFSELENCIPSARTVEDEVDTNELSRTINSFLFTVKKEDRFYFVRRYWHNESIPEIAKQFGVGESKVKMSLHRTRKKLKSYLEKRGV